MFSNSSPSLRWLVTGAAGFIGGHLVAELRASGCQVMAVDRRPSPGVERLDLADPADLPRLAELCRRADAVVHLAGRPGVRERGPQARAARRRDNVLATARLLEVVPKAVPVVVASSSSVYGSCVGPSREGDPLRPLGDYGRSKLEAEMLCVACREAGWAVTVVRPFTVVGERQRPDMALARWIEAARTGRPIRVFGSLERRRDLTDVRDVVLGIRRVIETGFVGTVNLGSGRPIRLGEMVETVMEVVGSRPPVVVEPGSAVEADFTWADTSLCEAELGFVPSLDLPSVVRRQAEACRPVAVSS